MGTLRTDGSSDFGSSDFGLSDFRLSDVRSLLLTRDIFARGFAIA